MCPRIKVILLRCHNCGNALDGLGNDRVFFCLDCRKAFEFEGSARQCFDLHFAVPGDAAGRGGRLHLPFFRFQTAPSFRFADEAQREALRSFPRARTVWVPGFITFRVSFFGDPGLLLTRDPEPLQEDRCLKAPLPPVLGCTRGRADAEKLVEAYLLSIIDQEVDIAGLQLALTIETVSLWAIPFLDRGDVITEGYHGHEYPASIFDDLGQIRELAQKRHRPSR